MATGIFNVDPAEAAKIFEDIDRARSEGRDDGFRPCTFPMAEDDDKLTPEEEQEIAEWGKRLENAIRQAVKEAGL